MATTPAFWLPRLQKACLEASVIPLWGGLSPFPQAVVEQRLAPLFQGLSVTFEVQPTQNPEETSPPTDALVYHATAAPIDGTVSCHLAPSAIWELLAGTTHKDPGLGAASLDRDLCDGFATFLLTCILQALTKTPWPGNSRWQLTSEAKGSPALAVEGTLQLGTLSCPFLLYVSDQMVEQFRTQYAPRPLEQLNPELAESIDLMVDMPIGHTTVSLKELKQVRLGDVVLLDELLLDLSTGDGTFSLRIGNQDVWSCLLNEGQLLADRPFPPHPENRAMSFPPDHPEDFSEFDDLGSFDDLELDDDLPPEPPPAKKGRTGAKAAASADDESVPMQEGSAVDRLKVQLTVSLGRITMTARDLLEIRPGNTLDLPVNTQGPVDLLVGTERVGRGELIQLGDHLGIRILEI
ncbi:MAG: type III secretion system cytoplasmic ring protein SctQ [Chlamydiia bacterium]